MESFEKTINNDDFGFEWDDVCFDLDDELNEITYKYYYLNDFLIKIEKYIYIENNEEGYNIDKIITYNNHYELVNIKSFDYDDNNNIIKEINYDEYDVLNNEELKEYLKFNTDYNLIIIN